MRRFLAIIGALAILGVTFLAGWRIMIRVWPKVKPAVVSALNLPTPTPAPTPEPYFAEGTARLGDPIAPGDTLIYYFYRETCPYCRIIDGMTSGLPEEITLPDGSRSPVRLIALNKSNEEEMAAIQRYYDEHGLGEDRQYVPSIIIGDRYMMGTEEIHDFISALLSGEGLTTPLLDGGERIG